MGIIADIETTWSLWRVLRTRQKKNPTAMLQVPNQAWSQPIPPEPDPEHVFNAINLDPWVFTGVVTIAKQLSAAPLIVQEWTIVDGKEQWTTAMHPELSAFCVQPNPDESMDTMLWRLAMAAFTGNAYLVQDDKTPDAWYYCDPQIIKPIADKTTGDVHGWELEKAARKIQLTPDQVIHIPMPGVLSHYHGQSPMMSIQQQILLNWFYSRYLKDFFKNNAVPLGALESEQPLTDEIKAATRADWESFYRGEGNWHRIAILGWGLKYSQITPPLKELIVETCFKVPREAILAVLGVPPACAGIFEYANYANSREQKVMLWENGIIPLQRVIASTLTLKLARKYGDNLRLVFDNSNIKALQEDETEKARRHQVYVQSGILTPNEVRSQLGLEPIEGGDQLRQGGGGLFEEPVPTEEQTERRIEIVSRKGKSTRRQELWADHYKALTRVQRECMALVRSYWDDQAKRVLAAVNGLTIGGKLSYTLLYSQLNNHVKDAESEAILIFDRVLEDEALVETVTPFAQRQMRKAGQQAVREVGGIGMTFNLENPKVQAQLGNLINRFKDINQYSYERIVGLLDDAYREKLSIEELKRSLLSEYEDWSQARARRVAMTEMGGLVNGGHLAGYEQAGVEQKEWLSAFLSTSRQEHMDADGQIVPINQPFDVGGEGLAHPGDPAGSAANVINCYCKVMAAEGE